MVSAIAKLSKHKVAKNTSVLVLSQLASRAVGIFYIAALGRYVGTEGVGILSTAQVLNSLLILLVAPGLDTLFVRDVAADLSRAGNYLSNMLFIRFLLAIPYVLLVEAVSRVAGYPPETVTIIHIYIAVYLLDAFSGILLPVFRAFERMEYEAASQALQDMLNIGLSLLAIFMGWSLVVIALISVLARVVRVATLVVLMSRKFVQLRFQVSPYSAKELFRTSLPFGALLIVLTVQSQLGTFVLSLFRPASVVGIYSAASFVVTTLLMLANAFSTAIFPTLSSLHSQSTVELRRFYHLAYKYLLVVGFPMGLGTVLVGDRVVSLLYGNKFSGSADVMRIMGVFLFTLVGYSNGPLLMAAGRQRFFMWTQAVAVLANGLLLILLVPSWGPVGAATAFVLPGIGTFFVHSIASHRLLALPMPWSTMSRILAAALFMGAVVSAAIWWWQVPWLLAALVVGPISYFVALFALRIPDRAELRDLARGHSGSHQQLADKDEVAA